MDCGTEPIRPALGGRALAQDDYSLGGSVCRYTTDNAGNAVFLGAELLQDSLENDFDELLSAPACTTPAATVVNTSISFYGPESSTPQPVYIELDGCRRVLIADHQPLSATANIIDHFA